MSRAAAVLAVCAAWGVAGTRPAWDYEYDVVDGDVQVPRGSGRGGQALGATPLTSAAQLFPVGQVVNYVIAAPISQTDSRIAGAVADWEAKTCFRFRRCASDASCQAPYIRFAQGSGCSSPVGRRGAGVNHISLATGCGTGAAIHEIGHSLGLWGLKPPDACTWRPC